MCICTTEQVMNTFSICGVTSKQISSITWDNSCVKDLRSFVLN